MGILIFLLNVWTVENDYKIMETLNNIPVWYWAVPVLAFLVIILATCLTIYYEVRYMAARREAKALQERNRGFIESYKNLEPEDLLKLYGTDKQG